MVEKRVATKKATNDLKVMYLNKLKNLTTWLKG